MKHFCFLAVVCVAIFLGSCKKENLSNTVLNSTSAESLSTEALAARTPKTRYGADIGSPPGTNDFNFQMNVAGQLGVSCLRAAVTAPSSKLGSNLVPELNTQYKVLLNFSSPGKGKKTIPFRTDTKQYKKDLNDVLNTFKVMPVVAVIENEESNLAFYNGSAKEYITQLKAAIGVMHNRGISVANGGITSTGLCYLVYKDFLAQRKFDSAALFKQQTLIEPDSAKTINRGMFIDTLLTNYANINLNFVNFHWKATSPDTLSLHQVINYLKKRTGKKIISNELGQLDYDTNTLLRHVQMCTNQFFPYIIWYSPDQDAGKRGTPLQYPDGTLTPTGIAYQSYLAGK